MRADDIAVGAQFPFGRRDAGEPFAQRVIEVAQQCAAADHQGDPDTERGEDVREFGCYETASDDHQVRGQLGYPHDGVAGVVVDAALEDRRRDHRPRAGGDHHLFGGELFAAVGAQQIPTVGLNRTETGVPVVDVNIGGGPSVVFTADRDRVDAPEDARDDVVPTHPVDVRVDAVTGGGADRFGDLGGVDEHLGGDASDVQAGSAECSLFADRDSFAGIAFVENAVARTGSDDREVVGLHPLAPQPLSVVTLEAAPR